MGVVGTLAKVARASGVVILFVTAAAGGLVVHMDVPAVRRAVVARVNQLLASVVPGRIVIDRLGTLEATRLDGVDAHVVDPEGETVVRVTGMSARFSTFDLLRSLAGGQDVRVGIEELSIDRADVSLDADGSGSLRIARAFVSTAPPGPPSSGGGVRLRIPHARIAHARVHGQPPGAPPIDADVDGSDATVEVSPDALLLQVAHAGIVARELPPGVTTRGTLDARFTQPAADGSDRFVHATWRGSVGELAGTADATYDAGALDAVVDLPATRPECVRALWAACPFGEATSAHAEVHGRLERLLVTAQARVGRGTVDIVGPASVGTETRASLRVTASGVDAHALTPSAPATDLDASGQILFIAAADGAAGALVAVDVPSGTVGAARIPAIAVDGRLSREATGALGAEATVAVHEPGAPATATVRLVPQGASFQLAFDASVVVPRLDGVARLGPVARGSGRARAHGTLDLASGHLDARAEASVAAVEVGASVRLRAAALTAHASGPVVDPWIEAEVLGQELTAGPLRFDRLRVRVDGPPTRAPVKVSLHGHETDFFARATVGLGSATTLRDVLVTAERNGESVRAEAASIRLAPHEVSVDALDVTGVGSPVHATVRAAPGTLTLQARSKGVDLTRLGRIAGVERLGGRISFDVDASVHAKSATGRVALDLSQGTLAGWHDAQAHVDATLEERRAAGHVTASLGGIGTLDVSSTSLELGPEGPLEGSAWRTAWGEVDLAAHVDVGKLAAELPKGTFPAGTPSGSIDVQGRVARDSPRDDTPELDLTASTKDLALTGTPIPWRIDGVGVKVHAHVDGRTGSTHVEVALADVLGPLVTVQASSAEVPYGRLFTSDAPVIPALLAMPLRASATVPPRELDKLPSFLGTRGMGGRIAADVDWQGSIARPTLSARATLDHGSAGGALLSLPVDLAVSARYDGSRADASVAASARGEEVLSADGRVEVRMADLLGGGELPWRGSAHGTLTAFPLQSVAALDDRQVRGRASGTFELDGLHDEARAKVALELDALQVGDVACRPTTVEASIDGHAMDATARITETDGSAEAHAHFGSRWGKALAPSIDPAQPADVRVTAKHFRAAVLLPFVSKYFSELDGRIDGDARVQIDPAAKTMKPAGTVTLTGGVLELNAMGSELHDATAKITMTPDGVVRLENASARGLSGHVEAAATARFQGTELVGVRGLVQVPRKDPMPLVVDGVQAGMLDGRIDLAVDRGAAGLDVQVEVPNLRLQLPLASRNDVQTLGSLSDVRVGFGRSGQFVPVALDAGDAEVEPAGGPQTPIRVSVHLGSDVEVRRGNDLDVRMEGRPVLTIAESVTATGQIRLTHGTLNVQGKTFTIDNGTITFVDDPTNPQVVLTASWNAPDGTTVFADFVGPLKTGKVTLRSEPALTNDRILSLLLYGTQDQGGSGGGSPELGAAGGVAGSAASANINRALGGVNHALDSLGLGQGISTNLDTSQTTPRPEVEVQIARDISFQVAWVLGVPPPGSNPDTTLFTIRWRFLRQWQVETTVGDAGTSILDLVWQRRY